MSDPENSSLDPQPFRSKTPMPVKSEQNMNGSEISKPRVYRPAPASMKRKREKEAHNMELLKMCKPLSIKLNYISQQVINKVLKKCEHTNRNKKRNRWQKGFVDKAKKKIKSEKSSEANKIPNCPPMMPTHPWGCCRIIPFERNRSRSHRRFSSSKSRHSIGPERLEQEIPNERISEPSTSKMALRDRKLSQEDKRSTIKAKENAVLKGVTQNSEPHSTVSLPVTEKSSSISKEEFVIKPQEDEFVCRRTIPYIRKSSYKSVFNSQINDTSHAGDRRNLKRSETPVQNEDQTLEESKPRSSKSSKREKRNSETEKEYSSCSKSEPFIFKNRSRERDTILQQATIDTKSGICEKPSELKSKVCEKTDETKAPEPNVSKETENDENMEDNFAWNCRNMWKFKRKNRSRRISSSSSTDEAPKKKTKHSTLDCSRSDEKKGDSSFPHEKTKLPSHSVFRTLCPPSCTNSEHHSNFFNFLYEKPKKIPLKEGRVVLVRLEDIENDPYVISWRNSLIKVEKEEVEEEDEAELEETLEDPRYYLMYEDGTMSNEALPQEAIYQMSGISDFQIGQSCQVYEKVNSYEGELINNRPMNMSKYFNRDEALAEEDLQADLPKDDDLIDNVLRDNTLRDDVPTDDSLLIDDDVLEFDKYPKVLLIRLETLVGTLDSEYSASEIETLEEKYIDFMMNSNFSYDKQSQSFFDVYKRLHAMRAKEREIEVLNDYSADLSFYIDGDTSEINEMEETDSRDDYVDEKPLIIALDAEREEAAIEDWVTDESSNNSISAEILASEKLPSEKSTYSVSSVDQDSGIAVITTLSEDPKEKVSLDNNSDSTSTEFVTYDAVDKRETSKDPFLITCKFCKVSFRSLHSFSLHKTDCYSKNKKPLKCGYCGHYYKCRRTLKLHIQYIHGKGDSVDENKETDSSADAETKSSNITKISSNAVANAKVTSVNSSNVKASSTNSPNAKASSTSSPNAKVSSNTVYKKKPAVPVAQNNLSCGVCSVIFDTRESLWDHVYKHTERELQDAYKDATKNKKDEELRNKILRVDQKKKENQNKAKRKKYIDPRNESREWANKYAQWKDRILYKMNSNETDKTGSTSQNSMENQTEEIVLSSSESEESRKNNKEGDNIENNSSTSRSSVIKNTKLIQEEVRVAERVVTMCPCHSNDTSTMVNGDMQIEMVLLCEICQVLFRRRDCFEVHYRVNKLCNLDRTSRLPKLFCSSCRIILNSLPEMRHHLEKHAEVNRQGHVTFLCNICKVMFFGVGSLFYSHWFNHNKDVNFLASRYSFPKLSIVPIMSLTEKANQNQKEEYLFVAEYVCKDCKIPFGSEADLEKHTCSNKPSPLVNIEPKEPKEAQAEPKPNIIVKVNCLACKKVYPNKEEYDVHQTVYNHVNSTKAQYICVATTPEQRAYICTQCKTVRMSVSDLKEHWIFHQPWREKFTCANCPDVRSSKFQEIEGHCKRCNKNAVAVCNVSLVTANYKCQPCNLHFENGKDWKEHHQVCSRSNLFSSLDSGIEISVPPVLPSATPVIESSVSVTVPSEIPLTISSEIPLTISSEIPLARSSKIPSTVPSKISTIVLSAVATTAPSVVASTVEAPVKPSSSSLKGNFIPILPKPKPLAPKLTSASLLEKYLILSSVPNQKRTSTRRDSQDVEVIDILSESSSRSSITELFRERNSLENAEVAKSMPELNTNEEQPTIEEDNVFDSYTSGKLRSEYRRKDVSLSKAVVCYPPKRKSNKRKEQLIPRNEDFFENNPTSNSSKNQDVDKANVAMTAVNPEFESLLTELEDLEKSKESSKKSSKVLRNVRKKSSSKESNPETLNTANAENSTKTNEEVSISEAGSLSIASETTSSKCGEKESLSPLPFEVILLQEEEEEEEEDVTSLNPVAVAQNWITQVDINSNKSVVDQNSVTEQNIGSDQDIANSQNVKSNKNIGSDQNVDKIATNNRSTLVQSSNDQSSLVDQNTASIIEEYIEYIMMDEAESDNSTTHAKTNTPVNSDPIVEAPPPIEKVAPTRLRVKTLAELQEIKMHVCDTCGQSFDTKENFDEHTKAKCCAKTKSRSFLQSTDYSQPSQDPISSGIVTETDYEVALTQNLIAKGTLSPVMDFVPPLVPLSIQQFNTTSSSSNLTSVSPSVAVPDVRRHSGLPFGSQNYNNNTGVIQPSSAHFGNSASHAHRSGAIQLPERTGGSAPQKRPSGAATRIQNLSHSLRPQTPGVIQHRGLPQTYHRNTGRVNHPVGSSTRHPPPYSSGPIPIRPALEKPNSLTCTTCSNFTAKSLSEFSTHLLMHFMETSTNRDPASQMINDNDLRNLAVHQENQQIDPALRNSPNTSGYQNSQIAASDIYGARSSSVAGGAWQTPARYIYACQLCSFRTETKASIRLHEKNHMAVAAMRQKNLQRLQNQHIMQDAFQVQHQQQQRQPQISSTLSQLIDQQKTPATKPSVDTSGDKNSVILYTRLSSDIYQCQLCNNFLFSTQEEFMRHLQVAHKESRKEATADNVSDNDTVCFVCDYCETPQIFESEVNLRKHMNFLHNHLCHICSQRCTSREILQSHLLSHKLENQTQ